MCKHLENFSKAEPIGGKFGNMEPNRPGPESRIVPLEVLLLEVLVSDDSDLWLHTNSEKG